MAKLFVWPDESLFLSTAPYQNKVYKAVFNKLVVSLDRDIHFRLPCGTETSTRSYLVKAGTVLQGGLQRDESIKAIYYFSSVSEAYASLTHAMQPAFDGICYGHPYAEPLIERFNKISDQAYTPEEARASIRPLLIPQACQNAPRLTLDPRVLQVLRKVEETYMLNLSLAELAESVHLSSSRLEKLFKEQIGIPITTYRVRHRVFLGIIHLALGATVTDAALEAGFSNLAHFSRSFTAVHGIQPTAIFAKPKRVDTYVAKALVEQQAQRSALARRYLAEGKKLNPTMSNFLSNTDNKIAAN